MQAFTYHSPTKVIFGKGAEDNTAAEIKAFGGTRVLLVYGGGSARASGLLDKVERKLAEAEIPCLPIGGVQPNPRLSFARKGVQQAIEFKADFILAVGGGSVIDTAKAVAHGAANPGTDVWKFWMREAAVERSLPVGAILTIPAAGSETSDSAVITDDETASKRGLNTPFNRPKFAVMNPELAATLPKYQIACGIVDIMMHTLDRYFTPAEGNDLTDRIAEALLRDVIAHGGAALVDPGDYDAMSELMWCGSLSHNGLTGLGGGGDFAVHQLGHELSGMFDAAHGASLSAMWGSWAEYCLAVRPSRFARYAREVWGIARGSDEECAIAGIGQTVSYFAGIGMPTCFTELGPGVQGDDVLKELADRCVFRGARTIGRFKVLDKEDVYRIYCMANR